MTAVDADKYFEVAKKLLYASISVEQDLRVLDENLKVSRSAGEYHYGGPKWGQSFDQCASDTFEAGSTAAMAARELGYQIHQAGKNLVDAENASHPGTPDPVPDHPLGTPLTTNLHPTELAIGGTGGNPDHWDLVKQYVTRDWADCDEGRIATAGTNFTAFSSRESPFADRLYNGIVAIFTKEAQQQDTVMAGFILDIDSVCAAIACAADAAKYLGTACSSVAGAAKSAKDDCRKSLNLLNDILASYEADKIAARLGGGKLTEEAIDNLIDSNTVTYAAAISGRLGDIQAAVEPAVESNGGIYSMVSGELANLKHILGRTPRNTAVITGRTAPQNKAAGDEGERRAGVRLPQRQVTVIDTAGVPRTIQPDQIDIDHRQVMEVKNTNNIRAYSDQIMLEEKWAVDNGYTMTLVVDNRTQINDPLIQSAIDRGDIELVRKELDDNNGS